MSPTMVSRIRSKALIALAIGTLVQMSAPAQTTFTPPAVAPVSNPCPRAAAGSAVSIPPRSSARTESSPSTSPIKPELTPKAAPCIAS
jgi:hypothetical protein